MSNRNLKIALAGGVLSLVVLSTLIFFWFNNKSDSKIKGRLDRAVQETTATTTKPVPVVDDESIQYFKEVALGAEHHQRDLAIHKWDTENTLVSIQHEGTSKDRQCVASFIEQFNDMSIKTKLRLAPINNYEGMISVSFASQSEFPSIDPYYIPGNLSFTYTSYDENDRNITYSGVFVDNETLTQEQRCKHTLTSLTRAMGFLNGSEKYPTSTFFYGPSDKKPTTYTEIDKKVISYMYGDFGIISGDTSGTIDPKLLK